MVSSAIRSQHYFAVNLPASEDIVCKPNIFIIIGNCAVDVFNIVYNITCYVRAFSMQLTVTGAYSVFLVSRVGFLFQTLPT